MLKEEFTSVPSIEIGNSKHTHNKSEETKALLNGTTPVPFIEPLNVNDRLVLDNVEAKWNPEAPNLTLDKMSFSVRKGQLLAIIGPVGAGKVKHSIILHNFK